MSMLKYRKIENKIYIGSKIESTSYLHTYIGVEKRNTIDFHT